MLLRTLFLFSFVSGAHAGFEFDGQELKEITFPYTNQKMRFELTTEASAPLPHLKIRQEVPGTEEIIEGTGLTFEEHCLLTSCSPACAEINTQSACALDPDLIALKSRTPLYFLHEELLRLDSCTIIADADITFQSDHVQLSCFFKTPGSVIIKSYTQQNSVNEFMFTPHHYSFTSKTGMSLNSSSFYASLDINFLTSSYQINWQSAYLSILEGQTPIPG